MPYKSDAQRRFFHTDTAKKAGITDKEVNEFDQASKGKKLPEKAPRKMAFGGETNPKKETVSSMENNPSAGFADGGQVPFNGIRMADGGDTWDMIKGALGSVAQPIENAGSALMNLNPLNALAQNAAVGGVNQTLNPATGVNQNVVNALNSGTAIPPQAPASPTPAGPSLTQAAQNLQTTPGTSPDIYNGVTADQRAALYKQLLSQQASPGNLVASGVAGLGDAVARSFGGQNTDYQQRVRDIQQKNIEQRIGGADTQRQQRLQDLQANITQQENDSKSAYSSGLRQFYGQMTGKVVPSNVTAAMLKMLSGDIAKIYDSQLAAAATTMGHKVEAAKTQATMGLWQNMVHKIMGTSPTGDTTTATAPVLNQAGWSAKPRGQ